MPNQLTPFSFIAVLGTSPAVLTETLWYLSQQNKIPQDIHILTTETGKQTYYKRLTPEIWACFCLEVWGGFQPEIHFYVPQRLNFTDDDIRTADEDQRFGELTYTVMKTLSQKELPCIGSIAGGRKTMSAHLLNAFALFAKAQDQLVHVLVNPPSLEHNPHFFYPNAQFPDAQIQLVPVQFPRLALLLPQIQHYSIAELFQHFPIHPPQRFILCKTPKPKIQALYQNQILGEIKLTPSFYALCYLLNTYPFLSNQIVYEEANAIRQEAYDDLMPMKPMGKWLDAQDLSKSISKLNKHLSKNPLFKDLCVVSQVGKNETVYSWRVPLQFQP